MSQNEDVKAMMINLINGGMTDKSEIYTRIVDTTKLPRPTVRRVASALKNETEHILDVLNGDV